MLSDTFHNDLIPSAEKSSTFCESTLPDDVTLQSISFISFRQQKQGEKSRLKNVKVDHKSEINLHSK